MDSTWIVVAHEAGARFFENHGRGTGLELVEEIEHPDGRARDRDMASDRPGRSFRKTSGDPSRASMGQSEGPHDRAVSDFARAWWPKLNEHQRCPRSESIEQARSKDVRRRRWFLESMNGLFHSTAHRLSARWRALGEETSMQSVIASSCERLARFTSWCSVARSVRAWCAIDGTAPSR